MSMLKIIFGQNSSGENGLKAFRHNFRAYMIGGRCCYRHAGELMEKESYMLAISSYRERAAWCAIWAPIGGTIGYAFGSAAIGASILPSYYLISGITRSLIKTYNETLPRSLLSKD